MAFTRLKIVMLSFGTEIIFLSLSEIIHDLPLEGIPVSLIDEEM